MAEQTFDPLPGAPAPAVDYGYYPFVPRYRPRSCCGGGCATCVGGLNAVYPRFLDGCEKCDCVPPALDAALSNCSGKYPDYFRERNYYHPFNVPLGRLPYGTGACSCDPKRSCLDPRASNFSKHGQVHCQSACVYRKPRVCRLRVEPERAPVEIGCGPCAELKASYLATGRAPCGVAPYEYRYPEREYAAYERAAAAAATGASVAADQSRLAAQRRSADATHGLYDRRNRKQAARRAHRANVAGATDDA